MGSSGECSQSGEEDEEEVESEAEDVQAAGQRRGRRAAVRVCNTARRVPEHKMVPRETWPDDPCDELLGRGWLVEVVKTAGKAGAEKALCRFVTARSPKGQPFADEWLC